MARHAYPNDASKHPSCAAADKAATATNLNFSFLLLHQPCTPGVVRLRPDPICKFLRSRDDNRSRLLVPTSSKTSKCDSVPGCDER